MDREALSFALKVALGDLALVLAMLGGLSLPQGDPLSPVELVRALPLAGAYFLTRWQLAESRAFARVERAEGSVLVGSAGPYALAAAAGFSPKPLPVSLPAADKLAVSATGRGVLVVCAYYSLLKPPVEKAAAASRELEAQGYLPVLVEPRVPAGRPLPPELGRGYGTLVAETDWLGRPRASFYPAEGAEVNPLRLRARHRAKTTLLEVTVSP